MRSNEKHLSYVDVMRGIAILMVILVHTAQRVENLSPLMDGLAKYCQMGVQLFFVASAYTLCLSFERRSKEPHRILSFYLRRLFRIAPLYYLGISIYFVFHLAKQFYHSGQISSIAPYSIGNVVANVLFVHGFVPSANNDIVPGGWSIGTEMAFYLCFPLLFVISKQIAENHTVKLVALLMFFLGANLALQLIFAGITDQSIQNNSFLYFNIINQLPVFFLGIIAYFLRGHKYVNLIISFRVLSAFGFLFFSAMSLLLMRSEIPLLFTATPTVSAVSFVFLLYWLKTAKRQSGILCKIGIVSYSMYVFHFLFAWNLVPSIIGRFSHILSPDILLVLAFPLAGALTFLVSLITEQTIEKNGISTGARLIAHLQGRANQ